jgi:hypothetical protein
MAVTDPTVNYKWAIPDVGGDIGSWGGLLNTIFGNELDDLELEAHIGTGTMLAPENQASPPPGIDQVVFKLPEELDASEAEVVAIAARVTTLEGTPPVLLTARLKQSTGQNVPSQSTVPMTFDTTDHDQGDLTTANASQIQIPSNGAGLWQFRAAVKAPFHGGGSGKDDGRGYELSIVKNGTPIAFSRSSESQTGSDATHSGDISLECSTTEVAAGGDVFEVFIWQGIAGRSVRLTADSGTFFEGIRITPEVP